MSIKGETFHMHCYGCLSSDRNVAPLGVLSDLFYILKPQICMYDNVLVCWECRSILKKIWIFQQRVQRAQILMQSPEFLLNYTTSSLSTLQSKVIDNDCITVNDTQHEIEDKVKLEIEEEFNKIESDLDNNLYEEEEIEIDSKEIDNDIKDVKEIVDVKEDNWNINEDNKTNDRLNKGKRRIIIEIPKINKSDAEDDKDYSEEIKEEKEGYIKKKQPRILIKYTSEERPSRFKRNKLITKNSINMERFYVTCIVNEKVIEETLELRMSVNHHGKPKVKCGYCDMVFYKEIDLRRHKTIKHLPEKGPYKCCECVYYKTKTISELKEHWETHKMYKCCLCPNVCITEMQILRHLQQTHKYSYQCLECRHQFFAYRDVFQHYKEAHNERICDYCGKTYRRKKLLQEHIIYQHLPRKCDICGQICKSSHGLAAHKRICRPGKHFDATAPELSYCVECDKQYDTIEKYHNHLRSAVPHNPPVPVKVPCPECGKTFTRKLYMNNHFKLIHMKKSKHYCDICNKYYISAFSLRNHRNRVHEKKYPPKDKICDVCGRGFRANRILIQHKRTHTGEKPYQCSYCPSAFAQITARKTHERTQHKVV